MWGCMIHSYVIGRGNTATAYLQAGMIRPVPGATADAVVDVQVQRTGGESRLKDEEVVLFFLAEKRAERTCGEEKMATPGWTEKKRSSAPMRRGSVPQKIYWEGINLNKISKKIVSLVTVAAFATTLVPAAAFAAPVGAGDPVADVSLVEDGQTLYLDATDTSDEATINVNAGDNTLSNLNQVALWFGVSEKDSAARAVNGVTFEKDDATFNPASDDYANAWWLTSGTGNIEITAEFAAAAAGQTYYLWAGTAIEGTTDSTADVANKTYIGKVTVSTTDAVADGSRLLIDNKVGPAAATQGSPKTFSFDLVDGDGNYTDQPLADNTYVWVEDPNGVVVKADKLFSAVEGSDLGVTGPNENGIWQVTGLVNSGDTLNVTFPGYGDDYSIHAVSAATAPSVNNGKVTETAYTVINPITVNVAKADVEVTSIEVTKVEGADKVEQPDQTKAYYTARINDEVTPSDTKVYTVTGKAWVGDARAEQEEITVVPDDGMTIVGDSTVKTDNTGVFTFKYTVDDAASYLVKLQADNAVTYLKITHGDVDAVDIAVVKDGGYVLAGTDKTYASQVYNNTDRAFFSDAVQFAITDAYGRDAVGEGPLADEAAANTTNHADSVSIVGQPDDADLTANNFYLAWDDEAGVYTLEYRGAAKDLIAGEYQVRVALNNGGRQAVTVSFTAAEFGDVEELVLDMSAADKKWWDTTNQNNAITAIDDQVALGQWVKVVPKYVDANGLKVKANAAKMQVGINGDAVIARDVHGSTIGFATAANTAANSSLVGSTITVKVNDASIGAIGYVEKELTVVKNYLAETVSIDPTSGVVGEPNTVTVSVVDEDGNLSKVNGTLTATIVGQSDEEATVDLKVNQQVKNGTARMYLESDKAGTADVRVVVEAANGELYADTFTYTFGAEDPYAGRTVVMTIGSSDYLINNAVVEGDAAPYVDDAWRTMVPFRVLGEAFGAEVDWNQEAQSVTYTVGDTEIVMTIGENTYTLNGEEQTMDTAPVLSGDRTYVPVRFVAEDLGFEVTPLYDVENGATASVVFQK